MARFIASFTLTSGLIALALTQAGCLAVAAGAGAGAAVAYAKGPTEVLVSADPEKSAAAAKSAVDDLKLVLVSEKVTKADAELVARTAGDDKVSIDIKSMGSGMSQVSVRVGVWGDSALQQTIIEKIKANLPAQPR